MANPTNIDLVHILEKKMGSDPAFLDKLREYPEETLKSVGLKVTPDLHKEIEKIDWNKPLNDLGKQLEDRATKSTIITLTSAEGLSGGEDIGEAESQFLGTAGSGDDST